MCLMCLAFWLDFAGGHTSKMMELKSGCMSPPIINRQTKQTIPCSGAHNICSPSCGLSSLSSAS